MSDNPDRYIPRPLDILELWVGWDPSINRMRHTGNRGGEGTHRHILPAIACNDESLAVYAYPTLYPELRTDYYVQTTFQLNQHQNDRSDRLLLFQDILAIPLAKYSNIDKDDGGKRYDSLWMKAGTGQSVDMTLEQKWYLANELKDKGNTLVHAGKPREALYEYSCAWFTLIPHHINAYHKDDPHRYMVASTEAALFNNIITAILKIMKEEASKMKTLSNVQIGITGLGCWTCAMTVFYATSVGAIKRFKKRYDELKDILIQLQHDNPEIPTLALPPDSHMAFGPIMHYCETHEDKDSCFELDFKDYDDRDPRFITVAIGSL